STATTLADSAAVTHDHAGAVSDIYHVYFFFNDTATTEIYTLSLHDALPISVSGLKSWTPSSEPPLRIIREKRSEEHTSELQSLAYLVCRLLLVKTKSYHRKSREHHSSSRAPPVSTVVASP